MSSLWLAMSFDYMCYWKFVILDSHCKVSGYGKKDFTIICQMSSSERVEENPRHVWYLEISAKDSENG